MSETVGIDNLLRVFQKKFYQLLIIAGSNSKKKSLLLKLLTKDHNFFYINLNLELAQRLMTIPVHERPLLVSQCIDEIVKEINEERLIFDHIEILFEKPLKVNPLALLKNVSRYKKLVTIWSGEIRDDVLTYAKPGHPEYVKYYIEPDFTALDINRIKL
ncbi:MAG TPA: BREX-3 system P-loop-containing protein BrxF [Thermoanaerobacterales bacterium]|nr:BREX-3 system P-loop-containing protein BrxF [Thermoanaerobacterales bacterium]